MSLSKLLKRDEPEGWIPDVFMALSIASRRVAAKDLPLVKLWYLVPRKDITNLKDLKLRRRLIPLSMRTLLVSPLMRSPGNIAKVVRAVISHAWEDGVVTAGSAFMNGYDVIIDDKLMQQCKADFDIWFDSYAFGVLHRTEIEFMMTKNCTADEFPGENSIIFCYVTNTFVKWTKDDFRKGYNSRLPLPVGPQSSRRFEECCFPVVGLHLLQEDDSPNLQALGTPALYSMRLQQPRHHEITVAHPQTECTNLPDHPPPASHSYDLLTWFSNIMGVSGAQQRERAARSRAADQQQEVVVVEEEDEEEAYGGEE